MSTKLFVGNLAYAVTSEDLRELFSQIGSCEEAAVVLDRDSGQSRGFAFVRMSSPDEADRAQKQLDGTDLKGRKLRVDKANDQNPRRPPR
jgi:RNA recognition motif-containing protein